MTVREGLHHLLDALPQTSLGYVRAMLGAEALLANAPEDGEPTTAEDLEAIAESRAEIERGDFVRLDDVEAALHD